MQSNCRRSDKESHLSKFLFIGLSKRLKYYYTPSVYYIETEISGKRSPSHRPVRLQLSLDATFMMMPRAALIVVPSTVLRSDREILS
jgi:hypothetical protein